MTFLQVPFMPAEEIEQRAAHLLAQYVHSERVAFAAPISIDNIVEKHLRLTLEVDDLSKLLGANDVLGAIWFEEKLIRIDSSVEHEGRFSFTLAHEVGHWCLHRDWLPSPAAGDLFSPRRDSASVVCRSRLAKLPAETQADMFAAALLMPPSLVRTAFRLATREEHVVMPGCDVPMPANDVVVAWRDLAKTVIDSGNFTNVSVEAMQYRLKTLKLIVSRAPAARSLF